MLQKILSPKPDQPPISSVDYSAFQSEDFPDELNLPKNIPLSATTSLGLSGTCAEPRSLESSARLHRTITSSHEQFLDVPILTRKPQIPTDCANNDLGSKCRHSNSAGRGLIMGYTAANLTQSLGLCRRDTGTRRTLRFVLHYQALRDSRAIAGPPKPKSLDAPSYAAPHSWTQVLI